MRKYHRWIGLPFGLFLLFMGCTGALLAIDDMSSPTALERRGAKPVGEGRIEPASLPLAQASRLFDTALRAAQADTSNRVVSIRLFMQDTAPRAEIVRSGKPPLLLDALTGTPVATRSGSGGPAGMPAWRISVHGWLEYLHRGAFASWPGLIMVLFTGIALIALSMTGLLVYVDMFRRRRKSGGREWFWG